MTQQDKIIALLKYAGSKGINSYGVGRQIALQLPRVMNDLKKAGYLWTTRKHKNKSVDYILLDSPTQKKEKVKDELVWVFDNDKCISYQVPASQARQQRLI